jgi:hypothetical protein
MRKILKKSMKSKAKCTKNWKRSIRKIRLASRADGRRGKAIGKMIGSIKLKRLEKVCKKWKGRTRLREIETEEISL